MAKYTYSDGDEVEDFLLKLFKDGATEADIEDVLRDNPSWPIKYHLSKDRENLLNWYEFEEGSSILEIGAGCGAVTGTLLDKEVSVTAVELTKRRADVIRNRYKDSKNLTVFDGNIHDAGIKSKFDYVTLIGVLEYAGRFTESEDPYLALLKETKNLINEKGCLIIAIENKLGLKYWRGAPEDHTNILFDSLQNYPNFDGVKTFSKKEISNLLVDSGFNSLSFYYPIPDYKFCYEIYSDSYLPGNGHRVSAAMFPSPHPSENFQLFDEQRVSCNLQDAGLFAEFANSFLIFAKNNG